jgi:hypothetical protein
MQEERQMSIRARQKKRWTQAHALVPTLTSVRAQQQGKVIDTSDSARAK